MKKFLCILFTLCFLSVLISIPTSAAVLLENRYTCLGGVKGYMQLSAIPSLTFSEVGTASPRTHYISTRNRVLNTSGFIASNQSEYSANPDLGTAYIATETRYYDFPDGYKAHGTYEVYRDGYYWDDYWYDTFTLVRGIDF